MQVDLEGLNVNEMHRVLEMEQVGNHTMHPKSEMPAAIAGSPILKRFFDAGTYLAILTAVCFYCGYMNHWCYFDNFNLSWFLLSEPSYRYITDGAVYFAYLSGCCILYFMFPTKNIDRTVRNGIYFEISLVCCMMGFIFGNIFYVYPEKRFLHVAGISLGLCVFFSIIFRSVLNILRFALKWINRFLLFIKKIVDWFIGKVGIWQRLCHWSDKSYKIMRESIKNYIKIRASLILIVVDLVLIIAGLTSFSGAMAYHEFSQIKYDYTTVEIFDNTIPLPAGERILFYQTENRYYLIAKSDYDQWLQDNNHKVEPFILSSDLLKQIKLKRIVKT